MKAARRMPSSFWAEDASPARCWPDCAWLITTGRSSCTTGILGKLRQLRPIRCEDRTEPPSRGRTGAPSDRRGEAGFSPRIAATDRELQSGSDPTLAVSLAAGIPLKNLRAWMGRPVRWARAMPSPVARSGRGLTAMTFDRDFPAAARREIMQLLHCSVGPVFEIPESKFDAFTVTYSSSHGYHALAALAGAARSSASIARLR